MPDTGKAVMVLAAEGRLQQKDLLGPEGLPASFVSDDPRIFKTESKLFKGKNRKLFRQLQDFFTALDRMRESLGTVTPADAGNRISQAVEDYRQNFYDTSDSMFDSLRGRIKPTADKTAFATITGSGGKRAAGTRYTPEQMVKKARCRKGLRLSRVSSLPPWINIANYVAMKMRYWKGGVANRHLSYKQSRLSLMTLSPA